MSEPMNTKQFDRIMSRLDQMDTRIAGMDTRVARVEEKMVQKGDLFQSIFTVQGFMLAVIVGVVVVLNATIGLGQG